MTPIMCCGTKGRTGPPTWRQRPPREVTPTGHTGPTRLCRLSKHSRIRKRKLALNFRVCFNTSQDETSLAQQSTFLFVSVFLPSPSVTSAICPERVSESVRTENLLKDHIVGHGDPTAQSQIRVALHV